MSDDLGLVPQPSTRSKFTSEDDDLFLEDEGQRIRVLNGDNMDISK